jgi:hypothetical protein
MIAKALAFWPSVPPLVAILVAREIQHDQIHRPDFQPYSM